MSTETPVNAPPVQDRDWCADCHTIRDVVERFGDAWISGPHEETWLDIVRYACGHEHVIEKERRWLA